MMRNTGIFRKATSVWLVDISLVGKRESERGRERESGREGAIFDSYFESCSVLSRSCVCINKHFCGQFTCTVFWLKMSHFHNSFSYPIWTLQPQFDFLFELLLEFSPHLHFSKDTFYVLLKIMLTMYWVYCRDGTIIFTIVYRVKKHKIILLWRFRFIMKLSSDMHWDQLIFYLLSCMFWYHFKRSIIGKTDLEMTYLIVFFHSLVFTKSLCKKMQRVVSL